MGIDSHELQEGRGNLLLVNLRKLYNGTLSLEQRDRDKGGKTKII